MKTLISHATIVNEGRAYNGSLVIEDERIADIIEHTAPQGQFDETVDASGCFVFPGVIDDHVHFREPGLTQKADIESESRAAAYGGVTSYFDMPNTIPQTTTLQALEEKYLLAKEKSHVNYSFFFGATNDNTSLFPQLDIHRIPGIKLFMGSSTGNMLVDRRSVLEEIFRTAPLPVMTHCEDTGIINRNMVEAKVRYGEDPDVSHHPEIRSEEACLESSRLAVELARKYHTRLHIAHLTTAKELELLDEGLGSKAEDLKSKGNHKDQSSKFKVQSITAEATVSHLYFCDEDYSTLGTLIKCNPAIKTKSDREALRRALNDGRITVIGTDHAPHQLSDKQGGAAKATSGMPMIQFSLVTMLELVDAGVLTIERLVELMCHHPAELFEVRNRGFLRVGYQADLVIVKPHTPWTVTEEVIQSKCKWSPMLGHEYQWQVQHTFCNGHHLYNQGVFDEQSHGEEIAFR
ncbi:MAG: dihydroorotase [Prevotella sp.]|nr:dihydroorotase [Prevotella sp.]